MRASIFIVAVFLVSLASLGCGAQSGGGGGGGATVSTVSAPSSTVQTPATPTAGAATVDGTVATGSQASSQAPRAAGAVAVVDVLQSGQSALGGAAVRVVDRAGNELAATTSDSSGHFVLSGLPCGLLMLEIRRSAASATADLTLPFTAVNLATVHLGARPAVTREAAIRLALSRVSSTARVLCSMQPLPGGVLVSSPLDAAAPRRLAEAGEWLLFVDTATLARFSHPVSWIFVNAASGEVTQRDDVVWFPSVNGALLWSSTFDFYNYTGLDSDGATTSQSRRTPTVEVAQDQAAAAMASATRVEPRDLPPDNVFMIVIQGSTQPAMNADVRNLSRFMKGDASVSANLRRVNLDGRTQEGGLEAIQEAFTGINTAIARKIAETGKSCTLLVVITSHGDTGVFTWHGPPDKGDPKEIPVFKATAETFAGLGLKATPACNIRVFGDFCYSGKWAKDLVEQFTSADRQDVLAFAAARSSQLSSADGDDGATFLNAVLANIDVSSGDVSGLTQKDGTLIPDLQALTVIDRGAKRTQNPQVFARPAPACAATASPSPGTVGSPSPSPSSSPVTVPSPSPSASPTPQEHAMVTNEDANNVMGFDISGQGVPGKAARAVPGSPFATGAAPNCVIVDPSTKFAYVANFNSANISGFSIGSGATLTALSGSPFASGTSCSFLAADPKGRFIFATNNGADTVSSYALGVDGNLTPAPGSPYASAGHPYSCAVDPAGNFVLTSNSLNNNCHVYRIAGNGTLTDVAGSPFSSPGFPKGVAIHPSGAFAYVVNQIGGPTFSGNVSAFSMDPNSGALTPVAGSPFATGVNPVLMAIHPGGRFAYISNFTSGDVSAYTIGVNGALTAVAGSPFKCGAGAAGLAVDPGGQFVFVTNNSGNTLTSFSIDPTSGALTPITTVPTGLGPSSVVLFNK